MLLKNIKDNEISSAAELVIKDIRGVVFILNQDIISKGLASQVKAAPPNTKPIEPESNAAIESPHEAVVQ
jgi:hypothetical protein